MGKPGTLTWTDGKTVYVDTSLNAREQIEAVMVQASLIAAGSLSRDILYAISRRKSLPNSYLAIEGHRALAANKRYLPPMWETLINENIAQRSNAPMESLAVARHQNTIDDLPVQFGTIAISELLAANARMEVHDSEDDAHQDGQTRQIKAPSYSDECHTESYDRLIDMFTSPGKGSTISQFLQRMLENTRRRTNSIGPIGANGTVQSMDSSTSKRESPVTSSFKVSSVAVAALRDATRGKSYPEWDKFRKVHRPDWCTVREMPIDNLVSAVPESPDELGLLRPLSRLGLGLEHSHRQAQGDDIDIDVVVESRIDAKRGLASDERVYMDSVRNRRDISVLLLLDISGSVAEVGTHGTTIHEHQRAAASALTSVLHKLGDRVALYAFNSRGRTSVQLFPVKRFDDHFNTDVMVRLHSLVPQAYSRLGAAIRHGASILRYEAGTPRKIMAVVSDGLAYDAGYELDYGAEDAKHALYETRGQGIGCLCLSIGANTDAESLERVFGSAAYAAIRDPSQLTSVVESLFLSTLRAAEVKRSLS